MNSKQMKKVKSLKGFGYMFGYFAFPIFYDKIISK